ncbi:MAG: SDR family NAD(P)-dependent oxidoreductase [Bacteroidales bacterium]|nr:SDR family NAD(P)-dependent oxidoreductase [Bacteroidales bacterium]MCF8328325.1 SDR family NAD(P)-dependent oxidoreductase [Bacteroidales bacterium]
MKPNYTDNQYAIVTGASHGLGKEYALALSRRKINTILIDLPDNGLKNLTQEIQKQYNTKSHYYETNLCSKDNIISFASWANEHFDIFMLINNVGLGGTKEFVKARVDYINSIIQLNVMATSILTHQILPNLLNQPEGYILNVSSISAFSPTGYKTVYPASKVFINYFTRGLCQELSETNVFASVVNPGPMKTNEDITQRINKQGFFARIGILSAEEVAEISLRKLFKRSKVILLNKTNSFRRILMKIVPIEIRLPLITKITKREINR